MSLTNNQERVKGNFKRSKVLVIEDNADQWLLIKNAMFQCLPEITTVWVSTAEEALNLLADWNTQEWELPKLILQDLYLPKREDGWDLVQQIKSISLSCNRIPLVMFSSSDDQEDIQKAYQYGISSYLVKPLDFSEWTNYFKEVRAYWWETVTLPPLQFSF
jgi:CheY-like chemotaxis protein